MPKVGIAALQTRRGWGGGVSTYTFNLIDALAEYGSKHDYHVLVSDQANGTWDDNIWPNHIHFNVVHEIEPKPKFAQRLWRLFRRTIGFSNPPNYGGSYWGRQIDEFGLDLVHYPRTIISPLSVNTPRVLTFFDMQHEYYPDFFTQLELEYREKTYKPSVEKAMHLIVPSKFTRKTLEEKFNVPRNKISIISVGVDQIFQCVGSDGINRIRTKFSLPDSYIYYPANPWQHKNHSRLIAALRIYQEKYGDAPYLVLSGRLKHEKRDSMSLAISAGVENKVIDLGFVDKSDLPALYCGAELMVFPSLFEGFGIPLIEAMACGCPIAAANTTTIPEITNGSALLFDPYDPHNIMESIHTLRQDIQLRETLTKRGHERVKKFRWKLIIPKMESLYSQIIKEIKNDNNFAR